MKNFGSSFQKISRIYPIPHVSSQDLKQLWEEKHENKNEKHEKHEKH